MATRFWVAEWMLVITILMVMFEGSFLVGYVTRFTEEIFAFLISVIFIYEVFFKLYKVSGCEINIPSVSERERQQGMERWSHIQLYRQGQLCCEILCTCMCSVRKRKTCQLSSVSLILLITLHCPFYILCIVSWVSITNRSENWWHRWYQQLDIHIFFLGS